MIDVMFRKEKDGEIIAIFPHTLENTKGDVLGYSRNGQHTQVDYQYVLASTTPIKEGEEEELKEELTSIGYELTVIKKRSISLYREALMRF
jgi:hypothetical protein